MSPTRRGGWPGRPEPKEFVAKVKEKLPPVLDALKWHRCWIEILNEPNHRDGIEGWGRSEHKAEDFQVWYFIVLNALQPHFINLGFPGLAVGEWAHGERTWARVCADAIQASDWLGIHCYWQTERDFTDPRLGRNWSWYKGKFPDKTLIVTEAANSSCHNPELPQVGPHRQAMEYSRFARDADIHGVTFFMLGGTDDWAGFRIYPETLEALREF